MEVDGRSAVGKYPNRTSLSDSGKIKILDSAQANHTGRNVSCPDNI